MEGLAAKLRSLFLEALETCSEKQQAVVLACAYGSTYSHIARGLHRSVQGVRDLQLRGIERIGAYCRRLGLDGSGLREPAVFGRTHHPWPASAREPTVTGARRLLRSVGGWK